MNSSFTSSQLIKGRGKGKAERAVTRMEAALVVEGIEASERRWRFYLCLSAFEQCKATTDSSPGYR
jgi:hypothetical protein